MKRYVLSAIMLATMSGCSGSLGTEIDYATDEPARRIVTDILRSNDMISSAGLIKIHIASVESESLTFCNNDADDRTIKVRIYSEFGDNQSSGREVHFCVTGHGDIKRLGEQSVGMARPDKFVTWADIGGGPALTNAPTERSAADESHDGELIEGDVDAVEETAPPVRTWDDMMAEQRVKDDAFKERMQAKAATEEAARVEAQKAERESQPLDE
ncbi:hypothetical protein [Sphingopyxis sp. L1A2A]|uniref:hypothetical protein n=1 Tax=Sphingopyxis sp. L1A2A TaxID=2502247 RepID=UPI0010F7AAD1|nr:hypothetical protein [Sphingopyxis sp. L1A2A]